MTFISWLRNIICVKQIVRPKNLVDIEHTEVYNLLKKEFGDIPIYLSDLQYKTTSLELLREFLRQDTTNEYSYIPELYDCDDYSYRLMGQLSIPGWSALPFGIIWTQTPRGGHALNCFIDKERKVWMVEPQNDSIYKIPSNWKPYFVIM